MSDEGVFRGDRICETGEYLCRMVAHSGEVDGDTQQLMSAFQAMAWVVERLREQPEAKQMQHRLTQECTAIACRLLDKGCAALSNQRE